MGWTRHDDGSATKTYDSTGFSAVIEPYRRRFRWSLSLHGDPVSTGESVSIELAEHRANAIVRNRLARRRMHMSVYQNLMGLAS